MGCTAKRRRSYPGPGAEVPSRADPGRPGACAGSRGRAGCTRHQSCTPLHPAAPAAKAGSGPQPRPAPGPSCPRRSRQAQQVALGLAPATPRRAIHAASSPAERDGKPETGRHALPAGLQQGGPSPGSPVGAAGRGGLGARGTRGSRYLRRTQNLMWQAVVSRDLFLCSHWSGRGRVPKPRCGESWEM